MGIGNRTPAAARGAGRAAIAAAWLLSAPAAADVVPLGAPPGPPAVPAAAALVAARASGPIRIDGRIDEAAWEDAPVFTGLVESFPRPGAPASLRTEVRVLHDDELLYVAVSCSDPDPSAVVAQLARRDTDTPGSDRVEVALAPAGGLTAYDFIVNAAGVQRDLLLFADVNSTDSWDAVWDGAAVVTEHGWSAELAIPLRQLRLPAGSAGGFRLAVRRYVPRTHQVFDSAPCPRDANPVNPGALVVSRFGRLEGIDDLRPRAAFQLVPYVASRVTARPQYSDPSRPDPRLLDPTLDVGLDLKTALGGRFTLTGTLNPDFGQVEADQVIQNLSNNEQFFSEKRPFFMEGLDLFQPVGAEYGSIQQPFYSRRIGLGVPILGAAKVTGSARDGLDVGVLDSVVMGARDAALGPAGYGVGDPTPYEARPDRSWRYHLSQPFHLGPQDALPGAAPPTTNYFAGVARRQLDGTGASAGATFTAATPLEARCRRSDFASDADYASAGCASHGVNALALDLNVPGVWGGFAQLEGSQAVGGPAGGRVLRDGTALRDGDLGLGGHVRWGKLGGEPFRADVVYVYQDRRLDLNGVGFQPYTDYQWADLNLHFVRPSGAGPFHSIQVDYTLDLNWSADFGLWRGVNNWIQAKVQLPGYQTVGVKLGLEIPQYDTREIAYSGVAFGRTGDGFVTLILASDPNRALQASGDVFFIRTLASGPFPSRFGWGWDLSASWRPHARLETRLDGAYGLKPQGPRWVETLADGTAVFGAEDPEFLSLTLRQQVVFTPRLTAQLYAQLFTSAVRFGQQFYGAPLAGHRTLGVPDLVPISYGGAPASHEAVVNLNAVVRWEYRLGSTVFFVYTRSQSELPAADGVPPAGLGSPRLMSGPVTESVMVKWSWWFDG